MRQRCNYRQLTRSVFIVLVLLVAVAHLAGLAADSLEHRDYFISESPVEAKAKGSLVWDYSSQVAQQGLSGDLFIERGYTQSRILLLFRHIQYTGTFTIAFKTVIPQDDPIVSVALLFGGTLLELTRNTSSSGLDCFYRTLSDTAVFEEVGVSLLARAKSGRVVTVLLPRFLADSH